MRKGRGKERKQDDECVKEGKEGRGVDNDERRNEGKK